MLFIDISVRYNEEPMCGITYKKRREKRIREKGSVKALRAKERIGDDAKRAERGQAEGRKSQEWNAGGGMPTKRGK